jgi:hypothetical protein
MKIVSISKLHEIKGLAQDVVGIIRAAIHKLWPEEKNTAGKPNAWNGAVVISERAQLQHTREFGMHVVVTARCRCQACEQFIVCGALCVTGQRATPSTGCDPGEACTRCAILAVTGSKLVATQQYVAPLVTLRLLPPGFVVL